jgi:hypothetical protein
LPYRLSSVFHLTHLYVSLQSTLVHFLALFDKRRVGEVMKDWQELIGLPNSSLGRLDPLVMSLLVARGIKGLENLEIEPFRDLLDRAAEFLRQQLPNADRNFHENPATYKNDIRFSRLALLCWFVGSVLKIRYREDQAFQQKVSYKDPGDLFLHGVLSTRRGTCSNMAQVYVVLGWRLGWPVSLACAGSHFLCRYDDGSVTYNIEASNADDGTFESPTDDEYRKVFNLPEKAVRCGSDLRAVTPREKLGLFIG